MNGLLTAAAAALMGPSSRRLTPSRAGLEGLVTQTAGSFAGPFVTEESSLRATAVFACVRILAESLAALPLVVYRRQGRYRYRAVEHPLYELLHDQPNPEMTSMEWRETTFTHVNLWGNGYSEIDWDERGQVRALWPLRPDRMMVYRDPRTNELWYYYYGPDALRSQTGVIRFPAWKIHHVRGLSSDGVLGYSPIRTAARGAVSLALAAENFGENYFINGAHPRIILRHPGRLTEEAHKRLRQSWQDGAEGLSNAHRTRIIEEGMDVSTVGVPPEEAQFLETRKYQTVDIARIFRVPPHMLAELDRATFNNIEHMSREFVLYTLLPWFVRHEQAMRRDLLVDDERRVYELRYNADALLRGDTTARYEAHAIAVQNGIMTRNEVRELEDLNPVEGGDKLLMPLNMAEVGGGDKPKPPQGREAVREGGGGGLPLDERVNERVNGVHDERCGCGACGPAGAGRSREDDFGISEVREGPDDAQEATAGTRRRLAGVYVALFEDGAERLVRREVADLRRAVQKYLAKNDDADGWRSWLEEFYADLKAAAPQYWATPLATLAEQVVDGVLAERDAELSTDDLNELAAFEGAYLDTWADGYVGSHERQLQALTDEGEVDGVTLVERIGARLDGWEETEASRQALRNAYEAVNAVTVAAYGAVGVRLLMWMASGESCPFCRGLSGKVVGIEEFFVEAGMVLDGEGGATLTVSRNKRHGPVHEGCDCVVIAV